VIEGAALDAVDLAVEVGVLRCTATTLTRIALVRICRAQVDAVGRTVPVRVGLRLSAAAASRVQLLGVGGAGVVAVDRTVAVGIGRRVRHTAATKAGDDLGRIRGTDIAGIAPPVVVAVLTVVERVVVRQRTEAVDALGAVVTGIAVAVAASTRIQRRWVRVEIHVPHHRAHVHGVAVLGRDLDRDTDHDALDRRSVGVGELGRIPPERKDLSDARDIHVGPGAEQRAVLPELETCPRRPRLFSELTHLNPKLLSVEAAPGRAAR
jgi:hypothetical protein